MTPMTARMLLGIPFAIGVAWTIIAVNTVGRQWVTSRVLQKLVEAEPILIALWCLGYVLCSHALTRAEVDFFDLMLMIVCWTAFGHICWRLG